MLSDIEPKRLQDKLSFVIIRKLHIFDVQNLNHRCNRQAMDGSSDFFYSKDFGFVFSI